MQSSGDPVKRSYVSPVRDAQARVTRRLVVAAGMELFVRDGYGSTSIEAVAQAAGVSRRTVFAAVGSKAGIVKLALDWAVTGDDEPLPLLARDVIHQARAMTSAHDVLAHFASLVTAVGSRIAVPYSVLISASGTDVELMALAEDGKRQRLVGMTALAKQLKQMAAFRPDLSVSEAADVLWLYNDPATYHRLVVERSWAPARYQQWLTGTLHALLLAAPPPPEDDAHHPEVTQDDPATEHFSPGAIARDP